MTAKEYLNQARRLDQLINTNICELDYWQNLSRKISSSNFEQNYSSNRNIVPPFVKCLGKIDELQKEVNSDIDRLVDLREQIKLSIKSVRNTNERMVLQLRYINGQTWETIAEELHADRSTVIRWHCKALYNFVMPQKPMTI